MSCEVKSLLEQSRVEEVEDMAPVLKCVGTSHVRKQSQVMQLHLQLDIRC